MNLPENHLNNANSEELFSPIFYPRKTMKFDGHMVAQPSANNRFFVWRLKPRINKLYLPRKIWQRFSTLMSGQSVETFRNSAKKILAFQPVGSKRILAQVLLIE